jgi:hypothetical protein
MKKIVLYAVFILVACLALPSLSLAAAPPCNTRCSCAVSCSTLCSNSGTITCGFYGDCRDLCRVASANLFDAPIPEPFHAAPALCSASAVQETAPVEAVFILP